MNPTTGKSHSVVVNGGGIANSVINVHFNGRRDETAAPANDKSTGDHSIIVDASAPAGSSGGGIKNSTINLTVISRRGAAALSSFAHSLRSLFVSTPYHAFPTRQEMNDEAMAGPRLRRVRTVPYVDPLARRAVAFALAEVSSSASAESVAAASSSSAAVASSPAGPSSTSVVAGPITVTLTLVPAGPSGAYVDQAGLPASASAMPTTADVLARPSSTSASSEMRSRPAEPTASSASASESAPPTSHLSKRMTGSSQQRRKVVELAVEA